MEKQRKEGREKRKSDIKRHIGKDRKKKNVKQSEG